MNLYGNDLSFLDFNMDLPESITEPFSHHQLMYNDADDGIDRRRNGNGNNYASTYAYKNSKRELMERPKSPLKHRHDRMSPLPLGMDWSAAPRIWEGRNTVWPHDPKTGWSYCTIISNWVLAPKSRGSDLITYYKVQVGIQSPKGITTTRVILRRYNDFLALLFELKKEFPEKKFPTIPSKRILRLKDKALLEERRYSLELWIVKLLSDIDVSRSAPVANFLELEAAARSSFDDIEQGISDVSLIAGSSSVASGHRSVSPDEISDLLTAKHGEDSASDLGRESLASETISKYGFNCNSVLKNFEESTITGREILTENDKYRTDLFAEEEYLKRDGHVRQLSTEIISSDISSERASDISKMGSFNKFRDGSQVLPEGSLDLDFELSSDLLMVFPSDEKHRLIRVINTLQQRLETTKTDMEDLIARLNQEVAVRQFLATKVKDLEVELETTRETCRENMQQAVLIEKERFTQTQWDLEELRKKLFEMELTLNSVQDEKAHIESANISLIEENKMLLHDMGAVREELENMHKHHEELELKSKADVKMLVKEVKSLRSSQSEMKQDFSRLMKEKLELERVLQKEQQRREHVNTAHLKLVHECELLWNRLQECSVNFLIEEEDKLVIDTPSASDAIDLLTTSENRIGLLLAEAQLLSEDVAKMVERLVESRTPNDSNHNVDDEVSKMLADILVDNAKVRKLMNYLLRYTISTHIKSDEENGNDNDGGENPLRKTVLSKYL